VAVDGVAILEHEVRELIRRTGLDPARDRAGVVALVTDVMADYDERSVVGAVPPLTDPAAAHKAVVDAVAGLGPLQQYLDDPDVEEVWINAPSQVFVARRGEAELTTTMLTEGQVRDLVEQMLKVSGRRLDLSSPFVDASLPGGERLHAVIPDVTRRHWSVNIRKYVVRATTLDDLVALGSLPPHAAAFLHAAVRAGLNVLVSGSTQAGKTTMLNALCGAIPPRERVISCEEVFELRLSARDWVAMQCRQPSLEGTGEIPLRRLVKEALRMRPSRLLVGEVREAEALDLLIALNAGVPDIHSALHNRCGLSGHVPGRPRGRYRPASRRMTRIGTRQEPRGPTFAGSNRSGCARIACGVTPRSREAVGRSTHAVGASATAPGSPRSTSDVVPTAVRASEGAAMRSTCLGIR
jgi:pilus assembly protein CpaF